MTAPAAPDVVDGCATCRALALAVTDATVHLNLVSARRARARFTVDVDRRTAQLTVARRNVQARARDLRAHLDAAHPAPAGAFRVRTPRPHVAPAPTAT